MDFDVFDSRKVLLVVEGHGFKAFSRHIYKYDLITLALEVYI